MSSPVPDTNPTATPASNATTAAPDGAATTTAPSATEATPLAGTPPATTTKTKKAASIKAVTGFAKLTPNDLANQAGAVIKGLYADIKNYPKPPVDQPAFSSSVTLLSDAIVAAMDGGKKAKAILTKQKRLVVQDLILLAVYAQNNCNDDPQIFAASGFTAKSSTRTVNQPVDVPSFRSLNYGANSGQLAFLIKAVPGARAYFVRYALMNGVQPGPWTTVAVPKVQKAVTLSGLTPTSTYGFQVQALGPIGYSDWSATQTIICV